MIDMVEDISINLKKTGPDKLKDMMVNKYGNVVLDKDEEAFI